jgi:hypothetical protein
MTQVEFFDNNKRKHNIQLPSEWDEMRSDHIRFIFRKYEECLSGSLTPYQLQILLLYRLLGIGRPTSAPLSSESSLINISEICKHLDFIFIKSDDGDGIPQLSFSSIQQPLPMIRTKARLLVGPATLCQNLTFGEFRNAALALNTFFKTADITDLDECIAHLYRPRSSRANKAGRMVKSILPEHVEKETKEVGAIEPWQKNLIMMWFSACINYLQTGTITLGGEDVDMSKLFSDEGGGLSSTWNDLLIQLAREGTMGDVDSVDASPLMLVIMHMWSNYKENQRYEKTRKAYKA